jgi:hypothetical protein
MNDSDTSKSDLRWYQVRMRTLVVVIVVLGMVICWIGFGIINDRRIVSILRNSMSVEVGYEFELGRVHWLSVSNPSDLGLEQLNRLTKLKTLYIRETKISKIGLEHLKRLSNLKHLELDYSVLTNEDLKTLQISLPNCTINRRSKKLTNIMKTLREKSDSK